MGGLFGSITIKGNRLTDLVGQTSTVGRPIPRGWGRVRVEEPNVIWTAGIPKEHVKKKKQGKGGVKTEEYTYTLSYAIAFMKGPVYGFLTIKRGGKVVYTNDPNASVDDKAYAAKWLQKAKLYLGTEAQMPDATIESYAGAGQVSAFRGLCYIVVTDDDVTGEGGAVPQYEAVIIATPPDVYLTSKPYPNDMAVEAVNLSANLAAGELRPLLFEQRYIEGMDWKAELGDGQLRSPIIPYRLNDSAEFTVSLGDGKLANPLVSYISPAESVNLSVGPLPDGWLRVALVNYNRYPPESVELSASLGAGTLGP